MGIFKNFPRLKPTRRPKKVAYFFYRPLTKRWNRSPTVTICGLDGEEVTIMYNRGRLHIESKTDDLSTLEIKTRINCPQDLFSGFNNFLKDAYEEGVIKGPVNGIPVYLELQDRWTMTSDICRDFLEDVWHALKGEKISFAF